MKESNGIVLPSGDVMKTISEDGYKYLGILESDKLMEKEMKEKVKKEYKRRLRLILRSKLNGKNKIQAINSWAVALIRYGAGILDWTIEEMKKIDRATRKTMTMYGALHPKSDIDRLYLTRKKGGRGLIGCERCIKAEENNLAWYVNNSVEPFIMGVRRGGIMRCEKSMKKDEFKKIAIEETEERWRDKVIYGQFVRDMDDSVHKDKTWSWLGKTDLKAETEALICAAQEQAIRTNYVKFKIDKTAESPMCRLCNEKGESVGHVVSECKKLAQKE